MPVPNATAIKIVPATIQLIKSMHQGPPREIDEALKSAATSKKQQYFVVDPTAKYPYLILSKPAIEQIYETNVIYRFEEM